MRYVLNLCLVGLLIGSTVGCNTQAKWTYPIERDKLYKYDRAPFGLTVAVLPFKEQRPIDNTGGTFFLYMIPLMPFGWMTYERPDAARMFNTIASYSMELDEDLAKAAVDSIEHSGLVKRVYFTLGGETEEADLLLEGTALQTQYYGQIFSYGLSVFGPVLWLIGLPAGRSVNTLQLELVLKNRSGAEVWRTSFTGERSVTQGLYYNWGTDTLNFATLMEDAMNQALLELGEALPHIPVM